MIYKSFADVKLPPLTIPKISREHFASLTKKQQDEYLWLYKTQVVPCLEVFRKPAPFKLTHGGRGSGKSHSVASLLMQELTKESHRLVCVREFQNSIAESSYRLLVDKINNLGLSGWDIKKDCLENENGSRVIFRGLKDMKASSAIKSLEGYDRVFIEEGATISKDSLRMLIPTIRVNGSEIYAVWNPETDSDPIMSLCNKTGAVVVECNWEQNPWFTERLFTEMSDDYRQDPDEAEHTWGGKPRNQSENSIHSRVSVREAMERQLVPEGAKVVAADIARMGSDETVISTRHGLVMTSIKGYKHKTLVETADLIEMAADYDKSRLIRVDETGLGAGVVDILRARGYRNIEGINFGSNADDPDRYGNLPSQMWFEINMNEVSLHRPGGPNRGPDHRRAGGLPPGGHGGDHPHLPAGSGPLRRKGTHDHRAEGR